jgi:hypothetical protein
MIWFNFRYDKGYRIIHQLIVKGKFVLNPQVKKTILLNGLVSELTGAIDE